MGKQHPLGPSSVTLRVWLGTQVCLVGAGSLCLLCSPAPLPGLHDTLWSLHSAWVLPNSRSGQRHGPHWLDVIPTLSPWLELMAQPSHVPALMWPEALQTQPGLAGCPQLSPSQLFLLAAKAEALGLALALLLAWGWGLSSVLLSEHSEAQEGGRGHSLGPGLGSGTKALRPELGPGLVLAAVVPISAG